MGRGRGEEAELNERSENPGYNFLTFKNKKL